MADKDKDFFAQAQEDLIKKQEEDEKRSEAETWDPQPGALLKCRFVKVEMYDGKYGLGYRCYVEDVDNDNKLMVVWANATMLRNGMIDSGPKPGTLMAIQYFGKVEPKKEGGRAYHSYKVVAQESDFEYWREQSVAYHKKQAAAQSMSAMPQQQGPATDPF